MQWATPQMLEVPEAEETSNMPMYRIAIEQLSKVEKAKTPSDR